MNLRKMLMTGAVAGAALLATTAAGFAAPAVSTGNVNVRSGPGTGFGIVDQLRRGERVDVRECRRGWCFVTKSGPDGWVSSRYLSDRLPNRPPRPPRPPRPHYPDYDDWYDYDDYYPRPPRPHRPGRDNGSVCFNGPNGYFCFGA